MSSTLWEPHLDGALGLYQRDIDSVLRLSLGAGVYLGYAQITPPSGGQRFTTNTGGGALRFGVGWTMFRSSPVGLAIDLIGELGWIGSARVNTGQILIGPWFHL